MDRFQSFTKSFGKSKLEERLKKNCATVLNVAMCKTFVLFSDSTGAHRCVSAALNKLL